MATRRRKQGGGRRRQAVGAEEPLRTCVACRTTGPKEGLLRFVRAPDGEVWFDVGAEMPGRGAWTCPDPACVEKAKDRGGFARAFEAAVIVPVDLIDRVRTVLETEALHGLGLLRRQGRLWPGRTEALQHASHGEAPVVVTARDLAERSVREAAAAVEGRAVLVVGPDKASMGDALGRGPTGVLALGQGRLAKRVVCNLRRLSRLAGLVSDENAGVAPCESGVAGV